MMSFNNFYHRRNSKNKATSNIKIQYMHSSSAVNDLKIVLKHRPFTTDGGIINSQPTERTH